MASAPVFFSLKALALIYTFITIPPTTSSSKAPFPSFEALLIHRDSPQSPLYNPNATHAELRKSASLRSIGRKKYLTRLMSGEYNGSVPFDVENLEYIMHYKIGNPPVSTYGLFDTGSNIVWMQCLPCTNCFNQSIPLYDPKNSSSYFELGCGFEECKIVRGSYCDDDDEEVGTCRYNIGYLDTASSDGILGTDTIMLGNDSLKDFVFGCGFDNSEPSEGINPPGIVGASAEASSMVNQLASGEFSEIASGRFSYCFSDDGSIGTGYGSVKFGSKADIHNDTNTQTPLFIGEHGWYFVHLESINVNDDALVKMKNPGASGGNILIDSGTTYTLLPPQIYYEFQEQIQNALEPAMPTGSVNPDLRCCYLRKDLPVGPDSLPYIVFKFKGGFEFILSDSHVWVDDGEYTCLAFAPIAVDSNAVLGLQQHMDVNLGFDLSNRMLSFQSMCPWV